MPKDDPCSIATRFAEKLSKCGTIVELERIGAEIKASLKEVEGWEDWLRSWYASRFITLSEPKLVPEECLNAEGIKALARGEIKL